MTGRDPYDELADIFERPIHPEPVRTRTSVPRTVRRDRALLTWQRDAICAVISFAAVMAVWYTGWL